MHTIDLSRGAGSSGYTPLHYAARAGHLAAVQMLLDAGASAAGRVLTCEQSTPNQALLRQALTPTAPPQLAARPA